MQQVHSHPSQHAHDSIRSLALAMTLLIAACALPEVSAAPSAHTGVETSAPSVNEAPSTDTDEDVHAAVMQDTRPDGGTVKPMKEAPEAHTPPAPSTPPAASPGADCPASSCYIDGTCIDGNAARPNALCEYCDPAKDRGAWTPRPAGTLCDDDVWCNGTGRCGEGTTSGLCVTDDRPCPENGDVCRTCKEDLKQCGYDPTRWTWTDPASNLEWWMRSTGRISLESAGSFCSESLLCGQRDWHLATIDELRTLVRNCPATEPRGACGISDSCTSSECLSEACAGCGSRGGTGGYCNGQVDIRSEIIVSATSDATGWKWAIDCATGSITRVEAMDFGEGRCVRAAN